MPPTRLLRPRAVGLVLLLAAACPPSASTAAPTAVPSLEEPTPLSGTWKFRPGDDLAWAETGLDDSGWLSIRVPGAWGRQGHEDVRVAWYRLTLRLDPRNLDEETVLGLTVGSVSTGYELYAGGELLGGVAGPPPAMAYDRHATYTLPRRAVGGDGTLVLAFRIWRADAVGRSSGGIRQAPRIGRLEQLTRRSRDADLPALILSILFAVVALYHLVLYLLRTEQHVYLWYSLFVLAVAASTFFPTQLRFLLSDDFVFLKELAFLTAFALPALAIQFTWALLGSPIGPVLRIYQLSYPLLGLIAALTPGLGLNLAMMSWWTYWSAPLVVLSIAKMVLEAWRGNPEARIMTLGAVLLAFSYFHDVLAANNLIRWRYVAPVGFLAFIFSMAISLAYRFERVHRQLEELRQDLEARVRERTRDLAEAKVTAESASRAKGDFLANMSHEIRTPMNGIIGVLGMIPRIDLPDNVREQIGIVESSAESLLRIIDDILDFSKIEAGKMSLESVDFNLRETLDGVIHLLTPRAAGKGIELAVEVDEHVPAWISGDPVRLRQVLLNLAGNAVKFTPGRRGGAKGDGRRQDQVTIRIDTSAAEDDGLVLRFVVSDHGIGIEPEVQARLFRPFTQADSTSARRFGGTGLGLAICGKIVEMFGGEIGVESAPGLGSEFFFTMPCRRAEAPKASEARAAAPHAANGNARILLAEDEEVSLMIARHQVEALGYEVDAVRNGREALEALSQREYALVLMDCQMPEIDGYEATRRIRQGEVRHIPVVAVTAHAMEGDREKCLAAGMDDYVAKPFRKETLAAVLEKWLAADPAVRRHLGTRTTDRAAT